jgi:hypothetical protein
LTTWKPNLQKNWILLLFPKSPCFSGGKSNAKHHDTFPGESWDWMKLLQRILGLMQGIMGVSTSGK